MHHVTSRMMRHAIGSLATREYLDTLWTVTTYCSEDGKRNQEAAWLRCMKETKQPIWC